MPLILFLNLKGGVAKTVNAVAVAECLASRKKRVLCIDADHQAMASELLLGPQRLEQAERRKKTLHDLFSSMLNETFIADNICSFVSPQASNVRSLRAYLDCIPCSHRIDEFQTNMAKARKGYKSGPDFLRFWNRLRKDFIRWCNKRYDYTIVDCPPSFAVHVLFFLGCAEFFILPSIPDRLSVRGSLYLMERLRLKNFRHIQCLGTLWSMVRVQAVKHREIMQAVAQKKGDLEKMPLPFRTVIPNMSAIAFAVDRYKEFNYLETKYQKKPASIFKSLCREIVERIEQY